MYGNATTRKELAGLQVKNMGVGSDMICKLFFAHSCNYYMVVKFKFETKPRH